jgi:hypothetical protein
MKISGFSFVRNGVIFDYPFLESIQSILPLCDEFVAAVGNSNDDTLAKIRLLRDPKIKIVETIWDETLRTGGAILAQQTDIALSHTSGDWAFYLQGDEVVHERDLPIIRQAMIQYLDDPSVEGLLFNFIHFYGSYRYIGNSRRWYRREIRVVRNRIGVNSWRDAQGFRIGSRKMNVKLVDGSIYHYGWVKPPTIQQQKQKTFNRLWHSDSWISEHIQNGVQFDYSTGGNLSEFNGTHPASMKNRIESQGWAFSYDPDKVKQTPRESVLNWIEKRTGYRIAEYKNYILI